MESEKSYAEYIERMTCNADPRLKEMWQPVIRDARPYYIIGYDAGVKAECERWTKMLEEVLSSDPDMPTYEDTIRRAEAMLEQEQGDER
jgi:hypothetical protein